jgi:hypothetical protein
MWLQGWCLRFQSFGATKITKLRGITRMKLNQIFLSLGALLFTLFSSGRVAA